MTEHALTLRPLVDIEADINVRKRNVTLDILAMGRDLTEAKAQLEHGAWLDWLRKMDFGQRTAENWMRLAREIGPESSLAALPYTKALALISAPAEDREQLAEEAGDRSAAELKRLALEARAARDDAARIREELKQKEAELQITRKGADALRDQIDHMLQQQPKTVEVEPEDYKDLKDAVETLKQENTELTMAVEEAEQRAQAAWAGTGTRPMKRVADPMELLSAVTDFLARTEMMPQAGAELRELQEHELRSMEISLGSICAWADRMDKALTQARLGLHMVGEGAIV